MRSVLTLVLLSACARQPLGLPADATALEVLPLERGALGAYFDRAIYVHGIYVVAAPEVAGAKLRHAAQVTAQYLDNDADGVVDAPGLTGALATNRATLMMFANERDAERSGIFEDPVLDRIWGQDLYGVETAPPRGFDASLEETLHLIHTAGYMHLWPDELMPMPGTPLMDAMDVARGGRFFDIPRPYPEESWYHYYDPTCDYACQGVEYFYWGLTTKLGAQADRCDAIAVEWEPCTPDLLARTDAGMSTLLDEPVLTLPTVLPDGTYTAL